MRHLPHSLTDKSEIYICNTIYLANIACLGSIQLALVRCVYLLINIHVDHATKICYLGRSMF